MSDVQVCIHNNERMNKGIWGNTPPGNSWNLDPPKLLRRLFWDRSKAIVNALLMKYCIQFCLYLIYVWTFAKQVDIKTICSEFWNLYHKEEYQAYMTEISTIIFIFVHFQFVKMYDSRLFSCCFFVGSDSPEGQLMNSRAPATAITHVFTWSYITVAKMHARVPDSSTIVNKLKHVLDGGILNAMAMRLVVDLFKYKR